VERRKAMRENDLLLKMTVRVIWTTWGFSSSTPRKPTCPNNAVYAL
jgi:hypothetical protein